jgi:hypothetical protein
LLQRYRRGESSPETCPMVDESVEEFSVYCDRVASLNASGCCALASVISLWMMKSEGVMVGTANPL